MNKITSEKMLDVLIAGAFGDAFGYLIEFDNMSRIEDKYGLLGLTLSHIKKMQELSVSDDTQMTLFLMNALMKEQHSDTILRIYLEFQNWLTTQQSSFENVFNKTDLLNECLLYKRQAPGNTCLSALNMNRCGTIEHRINSSTGCGTIMRVAPIAFLPQTINQIFELGAKQGAITHGHYLGFASSGFFAAILNQMILGYSFEESMKNSYQALNYFNQKFQLIDELSSYLKMVEQHISNKIILSNDDLCNAIGEGWQAHHALGIALYTYKKSDSFEDLLFLSSHHRGDSDSTCTLAMQLFASKNSVQKYQEYFKKLDVYKLLMNKAKEFKKFRNMPFA